LHRKNSSRRAGWGDKSREAKRLKEERKKEYEEAIKAGWLDYKDLAEQLDLEPSAIHQRIKKHLKEGVETKKVYGGKQGVGSGCRIVHPDAIEKIKDPYAIPEGYLTSRQAAEYLGYAKNGFHIIRKRYNLAPSDTMTGLGGNGQHLYTIDDLEKFKKNISDIQQKADEERRAQTIKNKIERELVREQARKEQLEEYEKQTKGLICLNDCPPYFNVKSTGPVLKLLHEGKLPGQKIRNRWWFKPEDIEAVSDVYKEQKRKKKKNWRSAGHKYKNANQRYEAKQQRKLRNNTSEVALINKKYWEDEEKGIIHFFYCKNCGVGQPYCEFYVGRTYRKTGRHTAHCKTCTAKRNRERSHEKRTRTLKSKIRSIFGIAIKQHISKNRGEYMEDLGLKVVWRKLEEHCGYDADKLIKHIENQFVGEMSWDNHGQLGTTVERGNFCWAIDHIKPKNSFHYTSLNDKAFKECWSLDNLRPLETRMNIIKSDRDLRTGMNSSFRDGLKRNKIRGIWKFLPYTPKEARKHFEKQFDENMSWNNYGTYWHIDHIRPQASLPYSTAICDNFKACWSLSNLQPLSVRENVAKNSVWDNARWIYNDTDGKNTRK
jgi:hypothetical protein